MAKRNLSLIKYIWYSIELQSYDCLDCNHYELGMGLGLS
jgi:hypothetical protein